MPRRAKRFPPIGVGFGLRVKEGRYNSCGFLSFVDCAGRGIRIVRSFVSSIFAVLVFVSVIGVDVSLGLPSCELHVTRITPQKTAFRGSA